MSNPVFRARSISAVHGALRDYRDASLVNHPGLRGRIREIVVERLLRPSLPATFAAGTGKIVDSHGGQSAETDVVVYSSFVLPPILYSERDGIFPLEASFYALEIKSVLSAQELDDAIAKVQFLRHLKYSSGQHTADWQEVAHVINPVVPALFAFESDLQGKTEFDRYRERDEAWYTNPSLRAICVVGKGYWWSKGPSQGWVYHPPTSDGDEVIDFLSGIANTLPDSLVQRGRPRLGKYLMEFRGIGFYDLPSDPPVA